MARTRYCSIARCATRTRHSIVYRIFLTAWMVAIAAITAPAARAAESEAFATLGVAVEVVANTNDETFHTYWDPRTGGRIEAETPFYLGAVQLGWHAYKNDNKDEDVPAFWSSYVYLGWTGGYAWKQVRVSAGALAGNFFMDFGEQPFEDIKETESELGLAATARLAYMLGDRWGVRGSAEYRRIYTATRINLVFVSAGVQWTFDSPGWLREFLD